MAAYEDLLADLNVIERTELWEITYRQSGATNILRKATRTYSTSADASIDVEFSRGITSSLNTEMSIDEGERLGGFAGIEAGVLEWHNDGTYDDWETGVSVDGLSVRCLLVGRLANGTPIRYDDATAQPLFSGVGVGRPKVTPSRVTIKLNGALGNFRKQLNRHDLNPPCLSFPGTSAGHVDYGNVLNRTGTYTEEVWIYCFDPTVAGQVVHSKDTGSAGRYLDVGTGGSGALRWGVREQTPAFTDTPAATIRPLQWHHIAVVWDSSASTRKVYVDRVLQATTTGVTGTLATNTAHLKVGPNFRGLISYLRPWSVARTLAQIDANMLMPLLGTETGLDDLLLLAEGSGSVTRGTKSGSTVTGTFGTGVTWASSGWCGSSLVGQKAPVVIGKALDVPLTNIDPSRNIFGAAYGPMLAIPAVRSNHVALTVTTQYSVDLTRGLVNLVAAANGKLSADMVGETNFGSALSFDGTGVGTATYTCPAGSMTMACLVSTGVTAASNRDFCGWRSGNGAGFRKLGITTGANNRLRWSVINDAGTQYTAVYDSLLQDRWYHVAGVLDVSGGLLRIYVDGSPVASTAVSGTFNTVSSSFAVGRSADVSSNFMTGRLDEVMVANRVLTQAEIESLVVLPVIGTETWLSAGWSFSENTGTSCANLKSGGPAITLSGGAAWTYSRIAPADLIVVVALRYAGYTRAAIHTASLSAYIRQTAADCGVVIDDSSSCQDVLHSLLQGLTSYARPALGSDLLQAGQVALPTGTPDAGDFGSRDTYYQEIDDASDRITSEVCGVRVLYAENHNVMTADQLQSIVTAQPARYQFAQSRWREAPVVQDATILDDHPNARILEIESPLLNEADAMAEAARLLPLYRPDRIRRVIPFRSSALAVTPGAEIRVTYETADRPPQPRLGMGSPGRSFIVLGVTRTGRKVSVRALA